MVGVVVVGVVEASGTWLDVLELTGVVTNGAGVVVGVVVVGVVEDGADR